MKLSINIIAKKDLKEIAYVNYLAYSASNFKSTFNEEVYLNALLQEFAKPDFLGFCMRMNGAIIGANWYWVLGAKDLKRMPNADNISDYIVQKELKSILYASNFFIKPIFQNQGHGTNLRNYALDYLTKHTTSEHVLSLIRDDSITSQSIAEAVGYKRTGVRHPDKKLPSIEWEYWHKDLQREL